MTDTPQASGADLARQALAAARAAAKTSSAPSQKKPRRTMRVHRGEGRDPQGLGNILGRLTTEQGWTDSLGGGNILDRWAELCPSTYADTTQPVGYDPDTGTLDIRAASHTIAAGLRLGQASLARSINEQLGRTVVRRIRVAVGGQPARPVDDIVAPQATSRPEAPVRTRDTAHPGYRAALEAALAHKPKRQHANPYVAEAAARQEAALRAKRQPESEHREAYWELDRLAQDQVDHSEAVRRAALTRKRQEQAGGGQVPRRAFDVA